MSGCGCGTGGHRGRVQRLTPLPVRCGDLRAALARVRADLAGAGIVTACRNRVFSRLRNRKSSRDTSYSTKGRAAGAARPPPPARRVLRESGAGTENKLVGRLCVRRCVEPAR